MTLCLSVIRISNDEIVVTSLNSHLSRTCHVSLYTKRCGSVFLYDLRDRGVQLKGLIGPRELSRGTTSYYSLERLYHCVQRIALHSQALLKVFVLHIPNGLVPCRVCTRNGDRQATNNVNSSDLIDGLKLPTVDN